MCSRKKRINIKGFGESVLSHTTSSVSPSGCHLLLKEKALGASNCSKNFCLTTCLQDVFCSDDHDSSSLVLNMRGLHNYIMVNSLFRCRCIACRRCQGRLVIAPTVSNGDALEIESATGRIYPAPTHSDDSAAGLGAPSGRALRRRSIVRQTVRETSI